MYDHCSRHRRAFTLTELLTVVGLISLLVSLLMPLVTKVRTAADATACLATLRQMGAAWTMYTAQNRGRLPHFVGHGRSPTADAAWYGYWTGILDRYEVRGESILCAAAAEPVDSGANDGFGNVGRAWTGKYSGSNALRFIDATYRTSSYGYNGYLFAGDGSGFGPSAGGVKPASDVPVFFDCAFGDARPYNYSESFPAPPPPNLRGEWNARTAPDDCWRFLLARHGRGINVCMADGSARWVRLEETYTLTWHQGWVSYRLQLPTK